MDGGRKTSPKFDELAERLGEVKPAQKAESGKSPVLGLRHPKADKFIA